MEDATQFAYALEKMDGVGRVTAGRIVHHFPSHEALLQYPREQVLHRIKGSPNAEALVNRLFDAESFRSLLEDAAAEISEMAAKRINLVGVGHEHWPAQVADLPPQNRPNYLFTYGRAANLKKPTVSFFAHPPLHPPAFELAQELVRFLMDRDVQAAAGTEHGFDVVIHRLTATCPRPVPSTAVAHCGVARIPQNLRPVAAANVRAGGLLLSTFPPTHGPFDHDDRERALVQAALGNACVFVDPRPETHEWQAMEWAVAAGRPLFGFGSDERPLPERLHPLTSPDDFEWVSLAAGVK